MLAPIVALDIFVAATLLTLAGVLGWRGRRGPENLTLAVFLALVATNFASDALFTLTASVTWRQVGEVALALDPIYLLAFATLYPFRRRSGPVRGLFAVLLLLAAFAILTYVTQPTAFEAIRGYQLSPFAATHLATVAELTLGYTAAWLLVVQGASRAPTALLRERSSWMVIAVGIAVVPRLALVPAEVRAGTLVPVALDPAAEVGAGVLLSALALGAGFLLAGHEPERPSLRRALRLVGAITVLLLTIRVILDPQLLGGFPALYSLRWVAFAVIVVYGILAYEVVDFARGADRTFAAVGACLGGLATGLGALLVLDETRFGLGAVVAAAFAAGAAASIPSGMLMRAGTRAIEARRGTSQGTQRRLELYRAALESAWAAGPPDPDRRRRLERDRRSFGVSVEEARALEHVVATATTAAPRLAAGDEPATGLVLEALLGEGAHGRVFRARRYPSGDTVVVKEFHPGLLGTGDARRRLLDELRPLQSVSHPNIVKVLDAQAAGSRHFLVMEYVAGESLEQRLRRGPMPEAEVRALLLDVLDALESAHRRKVIHRDIKPGNVILGADGRARLTDFGVALLEDREHFRATVTNLDALGRLKGTLAYMAPEQVNGGRATVASDLYALGLVAYECLVGKPALDLQGLRLADAIRAVASPSVQLASAPAAWESLLAKALSPNPGDRFATASEMRGALLASAPPRRRPRN
jgi:serine/threonine-protein kinase